MCCFPWQMSAISRPGLRLEPEAENSVSLSHVWVAGNQLHEPSPLLPRVCSSWKPESGAPVWVTNPFLLCSYCQASIQCAVKSVWAGAVFDGGFQQQTGKDTPCFCVLASSPRKYKQYNLHFTTAGTACFLEKKAIQRQSAASSLNVSYILSGAFRASRAKIEPAADGGFRTLC